MANESGIKPVGTTVLVYPDPVEETTESGIVVTTGQETERAQLGQTDGLVVAISEDAFTDLGEGKPRCVVGERVIFAKYAGMVRIGNDGKSYRLIHDRDVLAVLTGENE
jgi:co-chaperonin GroES (HSP10)